MKNIDEKIKKDVVDRLCENNDIDASAVRVKVEYGVVDLTGSVSSETERELAQKIAAAVDDVGKVQNFIGIIEGSDEDPRTHIA